MSEQDHSNITLEESITWVNAQCRFEHNRKRLRSRAVAWRLYQELLALQDKLIELDKILLEQAQLHDGAH